jgi:membrane protein implicated in regulation of membrane protease activity
MPVKSQKIMLKTLGRLKRATQAAKLLSPIFLTLTFILALPVSALAYVGPGAGITLIGALWAVVVAVVLMAGGLLVWPLRAFLRRLKNSKTKETQ